MGPVAFAPASEFSLEQVTLAFNTGFAGYYLPMIQTPATLSEMMRENDVRMGASVVLLADGAPAGVGLVGVRGTRGWIAGMGVGPLWRRQGWGRRLLTELLTQLRQAGADTVQLEALSVNTPALSLYASMGFRDTRELRVYQGPLRMSAGTDKLVDVDVATLKPVAPSVALSEFSHFHQVDPAWQREARTLSQTRRAAQGLGLWQGRDLLAYVIFMRYAGGFAIFDGGARDSSSVVRRAHMTALLRALSSARDGAVARAINTPPGDALGDALDWLECPVVARQREMILPLDRPVTWRRDDEGMPS